jgi:hypothetical protein
MEDVWCQSVSVEMVIEIASFVIHQFLQPLVESFLREIALGPFFPAQIDKPIVEHDLGESL